MKHLLFTVTNDLVFDQRMSRICASLAANGYSVRLVGVKKSDSPVLTNQPFLQKRLRVFFKKGPGFYIEYNIRLLFYLLFEKADGICAIDLDTIVPVYFVSKLRGKKRVYDAHEYFSEMKEVITRPRVRCFWRWIEKTFVPKFRSGYTVGGSITKTLNEKYGRSFETIRNMPAYRDSGEHQAKEKIIIYQGAVNEARGFEALIPAMQKIAAKLIIYGDGNFAQQARELIGVYDLGEKVLMKGMIAPAALKLRTAEAYIGINLVENTGLNQYYSLANKYFDYIMEGLPQVTMNFPEYAALNTRYETALLIDDTNEDSITNAINELLNNDALYNNLKNNCRLAAKEFNWEKEEQKLLQFYTKVFE